MMRQTGYAPEWGNRGGGTDAENGMRCGVGIGVEKP